MPEMKSNVSAISETFSAKVKFLMQFCITRNEFSHQNSLKVATLDLISCLRTRANSTFENPEVLTSWVRARNRMDSTLQEVVTALGLTLPESQKEILTSTTLTSPGDSNDTQVSPRAVDNKPTKETQKQETQQREYSKETIASVADFPKGDTQTAAVLQLINLLKGTHFL